MTYVYIIIGYFIYLWLWKASWGRRVLVSQFLENKILITFQYLFYPLWIYLILKSFIELKYSDLHFVFIGYPILLMFLPKISYFLLMSFKILGKNLHTYQRILWALLLLIFLGIFLYISLIFFNGIDSQHLKIILVVGITIYIVAICFILYY